MSGITVGGRQVPHSQAQQWIGGYFGAARNRTLRKPYAYPAYDEFNAGSTPNELNDGDLLAPPGMLHAAPTIAAFYSLRGVREHLQQRLAAIDESLTLSDAVDDGRVDALLGGLVDLPDAKPRPYGIRLTTLLKVLHRKRPLFVPLYDRFVQACYVGPEEDGDSIPYRKTVRTSTYCGDIARAIGDDITSQRTVFLELAAALPAEGATTAGDRRPSLEGWTPRARRCDRGYRPVWYPAHATSATVCFGPV